jgi:MoxR-like ATPase
VKNALLPALRHRMVLSPTAELEGISTDAVLHDILESVEVPR